MLIKMRRTMFLCPQDCADQFEKRMHYEYCIRNVVREPTLMDGDVVFRAYVYAADFIRLQEIFRDVQYPVLYCECEA